MFLRRSPAIIFFRRRSVCRRPFYGFMDSHKKERCLPAPPEKSPPFLKTAGAAHGATIGKTRRGIMLPSFCMTGKMRRFFWRTSGTAVPSSLSVTVGSLVLALCTTALFEKVSTSMSDYRIQDWMVNIPLYGIGQMFSALCEGEAPLNSSNKAFPSNITLALSFVIAPSSPTSSTNNLNA